MYYPWSIPDEFVAFVDEQFLRFKEPKPSSRSIDVLCDFVLFHVAIESYYPQSQQEAIHRFNNPGISQVERNFVDITVLKLRDVFNEHITDKQIGLVVWAALLFCWSAEGERHVLWNRSRFKKPLTQIQSGSAQRSALV